MNYNDYLDYINSDKFKALKALELKRANYQCEEPCCHATKYLELHHWNYDNLGNEQPGDTVIFCNEHHNYYHHGRMTWEMIEYKLRRLGWKK